MDELLTRVKAKLESALAPEALTLLDESHLHAGHAGSRGGGRHLRVAIVAARFAGLSPLARHRAIHAALVEELRGAIHALAIDARAPGE